VVNCDSTTICQNATYKHDKQLWQKARQNCTARLLLPIVNSIMSFSLLQSWQQKCENIPWLSSCSQMPSVHFSPHTHVRNPAHWSTNPQDCESCSPSGRGDHGTCPSVCLSVGKRGPWHLYVNLSICLSVCPPGRGDPQGTCQDVEHLLQQRLSVCLSVRKRGPTGHLSRG
jgi:hypothetical protein